jgi:hypothetical protein
MLSNKLRLDVLGFYQLFNKCKRNSNKMAQGAKPGEGGQLPGEK